MSAEAPGSLKLRTAGQQGKQTGRGSIVDEQGEELQCRGIDPVQIFDYKQHRLPRCLSQEPGQQGVQGLLPLPLGCQGERGVAFGEWQREQHR